MLFAAVHESVPGTKRTWRGVFLFVRFWGEADMLRSSALPTSVVNDPTRTLGPNADALR
jgi:hypothetical protein